MINKPCPFCTLANASIVEETPLARWIYDSFPVSPGHSLIIPWRHVGSFFELSTEERMAMLDLLDKAKATVEKKHRPDGFNIGINDGVAAGQTIPHLHMHLIPRYRGDVADARGGVRWLIPDKADYWSPKQS